jgi:hypothetical protein
MKPGNIKPKGFVDPGTNRACQQLYAKIAVWRKSLGGSKAIPFQDSAR